jgi:hypothetical protein
MYIVVETATRQTGHGQFIAGHLTYLLLGNYFELTGGGVEAICFQRLSSSIVRIIFSLHQMTMGKKNDEPKIKSQPLCFEPRWPFIFLSLGGKRLSPLASGVLKKMSFKKLIGKCQKRQFSIFF